MAGCGKERGGAMRPIGMRHCLPAILAAAILTTAAATAEVRLAAVFSDHAVLQRERPLPVWGQASPGERVRVRLGTVEAEGTAGADGKWRVTLPAQPASRDPMELTATGTNTVTVRDILVGDVWLCSGQSNMEWGLHGCDVPEDIRAADHPGIRHFRTGYQFAVEPQADVQGAWQVCTPGTAGGFSAVGYHFAKRIHREAGVPVGLLTNAVGGTNIELWMSQETLMGTPVLEPYAAQMRASLDDYRRELAAVLGPLEAWTARSRAAQQAGQPIPLPPAFPEHPFGERRHRPRCVTLHNGHVAPLVPMALRGVLWYQGENNADAQLYLEKKAAMVADWRKWFGDPELPFYFVQLAAWQAPNEDPAGGEWGLIRDVQRRCLSIPRTGMACAIDIGDAADIHPKNKADVGERLALWALRDVHGRKDLVVSGPLLKEVVREDGRLRLRFDHTGGGLMAGRKEGRKPTVEEKGAKLRRFAVAGEDRKWHWAEAVIDGDTVVVSAAAVPAPVAVRYAYCSNPEGANLYNREGLPASPFRSDSW